jgi:hypothetical protein
MYIFSNIIVNSFLITYYILYILFHRAPVVEQLKMQVKRISMAEYEANHYDKENLQAAGLFLPYFTCIKT